MANCKWISETVMIMTAVPLGLPVVKVYEIINDEDEMKRILDLVNKGGGEIICIGTNKELTWLRAYSHSVVMPEKAPNPKVGDYIIDMYGSMWQIMGLPDDDIVLRLGGVYQQ